MGSSESKFNNPYLDNLYLIHAFSLDQYMDVKFDDGKFYKVQIKDNSKINASQIIASNKSLAYSDPLVWDANLLNNLYTNTDAFRGYIHTSWGNLVYPHARGNWDAKYPCLLIVPFAQQASRCVRLTPADTMICDYLDYTQDSILIYSKSVEYIEIPREYIDIFERNPAKDRAPIEYFKLRDKRNERNERNELIDWFSIYSAGDYSRLPANIQIGKKIAFDRSKISLREIVIQTLKSLNIPLTRHLPLRASIMDVNSSNALSFGSYLPMYIASGEFSPFMKNNYVIMVPTLINNLIMIPRCKINAATMEIRTNIPALKEWQSKYGEAFTIDAYRVKLGEYIKYFSELSPAQIIAISIEIYKAFKECFANSVSGNRQILAKISPKYMWFFDNFEYQCFTLQIMLAVGNHIGTTQFNYWTVYVDQFRAKSIGVFSDIYDNNLHIYKDIAMFSDIFRSSTITHDFYNPMHSLCNDNTQPNDNAIDILQGMFSFTCPGEDRFNYLRERFNDAENRDTGVHAFKDMISEERQLIAGIFGFEPKCCLIGCAFYMWRCEFLFIANKSLNTNLVANFRKIYAEIVLIYTYIVYMELCKKDITDIREARNNLPGLADLRQIVALYQSSPVVSVQTEVKKLYENVKSICQ